MAKQIDRVAEALRDAIISGELQPGQRIIELQYAAQLGVSRTPLRLALAELEREGAIERLPARGYRVRAFSADEIVEAMDVRGTLEGMAARLLAERGLDAMSRAKLESAIEDGRALLEPVARGAPHEVDTYAWRKVNAAFHEALSRAARNRSLEAAIAAINRVAFSAPSSPLIQHDQREVDAQVLVRSQQEHEALFAAIVKRQGTRAEALMREHAALAAEYRRRRFESIRAAAGSAAAAMAAVGERELAIEAGI